MHYVLLFPTGQLGWHLDIPLNLLNGEKDEPDRGPDGAPGQEEEDAENGGAVIAVRQRQKWKTVTMADYFAYRLHPRAGESDHIFCSGRLFQQFAVDAWAGCNRTVTVELDYV